MSKNLTRRAALGRGAAVLAAAVPLSRARAAAAPLKVAFVYVSPIGDAGWTYQHDLGRREMEHALGVRVRTTVVEGVPEGADAERVMRDLAREGHGLIVATSFGYLEPALRVAAEFPAVTFEHVGGWKLAPNLGTVNARWYEGRYLAGLIAGATSRSGVAGYVAGFPVPEVVQGLDAFALGMRAAKPDASVKVTWLETWFDPVREAEASQGLLNQGADVLANHTASPAVAQVAQRHARDGVRFLGYQSDMRAYAPDAQLASVTQHWGAFDTALARSVLDGTWRPRAAWGGLADGMVRLSALDAKLPADVRALVERRHAAIVAGTFEPFAAPLVDNRGRVRLASGTLDGSAIRSLDWLVAGVVGSMP
ncbi:MAG TPA: BMP family ABC transporter substrate-binding protein [Caldimonas sp.]|nr:BMP family ABC transporter substrate-binding protein [Caldimonas sp.]